MSHRLDVILPPSGDETDGTGTLGFTWPTSYTLLFWLIVVAAGITWVVPAGQYDRYEDDALEQAVPVPGTYHRVDPNPQGVREILMAPLAGFYDPATGAARAVDVALFVLVLGGFIGVVAGTGAMQAGLAAAAPALNDRGTWLIALLMAVLAAGATTFGAAEASLVLYAIAVPLAIAAGYDAVTGVAIVMLGAGIGALGSTVNPAATGIASQLTGISLAAGLSTRLLILGCAWLASTAYVCRYAERVRLDPSRSLVADVASADGGGMPLTETRLVILFLCALMLGIMCWGVTVKNWSMAESSATLLASSLAVGLIARMSEKEMTTTFLDGACDLLGPALLIGLARGVVAVLDAANVGDTLVFWSEQALRGMGPSAFVTALFVFAICLSFVAPSSSALALLTIPIVAPLADLSNVSRPLVVTACQAGNGLLNLVNPTSAVVVGGLAIGGVPYDRWLRFIWPLLLILFVIVTAALSSAV